MADTLQFEIVTPSKLVLSRTAELVVIPGEDGNFGVLPGHAPMLSSLRPGTIEIRDMKLTVIEEIFVEGGFAEVTGDRCTVLAEEALSLAALSRETAEARLKAAHDLVMSATTPGARAIGERDVAAAEAMIAAIEMREKGGRGGH